jgi:hypothetical protein
VSSKDLLGKHAPPVQLHFEHAARRFDQLDLRIREGAADLGRQTGGPRLVVSNDAILDVYAHGGNDNGA